MLHETTQSLGRERLQPRRVALRALRLYKEWEGAVEVVLDERHCGQLLFVRRVRLRLEQLMMLARTRPDIISNPQDLIDDFLEVGGPYGSGSFFRHM